MNYEQLGNSLYSFCRVIVIVAILAAIVGYFWASSHTKSTMLQQMKDQGDAIRKEANQVMASEEYC